MRDIDYYVLNVTVSWFIRLLSSITIQATNYGGSNLMVLTCPSQEFFFISVDNCMMFCNRFIFAIIMTAAWTTFSSLKLYNFLIRAPMICQLFLRSITTMVSYTKDKWWFFKLIPYVWECLKLFFFDKLKYHFSNKGWNNYVESTPLSYLNGKYFYDLKK